MLIFQTHTTKKLTTISIFIIRMKRDLGAEGVRFFLTLTSVALMWEPSFDNPIQIWLKSDGVYSDLRDQVEVK